ncbi:microcompartment protein EutL, partial [Staphylococcus aureus]|nr:microcompartment protein EutL [Staphylococcus aureus]
MAADEATKRAMVGVGFGRALYAGAANGPSPTAGEVLIMLGGPNPAEVRAGLDAMMAHIEGGAAFQWANDAQDTAFLAHVVSRTVSYLSSSSLFSFFYPISYLFSLPLLSPFFISFSFNSSFVHLFTFVSPPFYTHFSSSFFSRSLSPFSASFLSF